MAKKKKWTPLQDARSRWLNAETEIGELRAENQRLRAELFKSEANSIAAEARLTACAMECGRLNFKACKLEFEIAAAKAERVGFLAGLWRSWFWRG